MKVIVCGAGQVGTSIVYPLAAENNDVTVIDQSPELIRKLSDSLDVKAMEGFASHPDVLEAAGAADAIEANLECPNVHDARRTRGPALVAQVPEDVSDYTRTIRSATKLPLFIKLTPAVVDIREPCLAAQEAGADGVCLINTILGLVIDPLSRRPRLNNIVGGLSGPAIRPTAVKLVWDGAEVLTIPIICTGGICDASDAIPVIASGAQDGSGLSGA